ncbi:hypothetical protein HPB48_021745 [Haemaphysalis longicornis]|uniref:GST N-terminal domain-containing protein n=1 Tax=Haemaphysalis longicornis TaxID=44386 RepID=A0A9J6H4H7_HAELO|nr:hypothetical protein HPB48_021745 [Haemaphysalis longicornis]
MDPVLGYWDIRGLGQPIRYLLEYAGVPYEDKRYGFGSAPEFRRDAWLSEKHKLGLDFPNVPYYIEGDVKLTQSMAILQYLGRKHGLAPKDEATQLRVDILQLTAFDVMMGTLYLCYDPDYSEEKRKQFLVNVADKLHQFEAYLSKYGPFGAGKTATYVDFLLYEVLQCTYGRLFVTSRCTVDEFPTLSWTSTLALIPAVRPRPIVFHAGLAWRGGRAAESPSSNSSEADENTMLHDSSEGDNAEVYSGNNSDWINVVTKAQRRRLRKTNMRDRSSTPTRRRRSSTGSRSKSTSRNNVLKPDMTTNKQVVKILGPSTFRKGYPQLEAYCQRVACLPRLREYLASDRFKAWPIWSPQAKALATQHRPPADEC